MMVVTLPAGDDDDDDDSIGLQASRLLCPAFPYLLPTTALAWAALEKHFLQSQKEKNSSNVG